jgi:hypothetical protein
MYVDVCVCSYIKMYFPAYKYDCKGAVLPILDVHVSMYMRMSACVFVCECVCVCIHAHTHANAGDARLYRHLNRI